MPTSDSLTPYSAPPETAMRTVELDLLARPGLTRAILRPAWFSGQAWAVDEAR